MSALAAPGTARGDCGVYSGRTLLGTIRGTVAGVLVFDGAGRRLGAFPNRKLAMAALTGPREAGEGGAS